MKSRKKDQGIAQDILISTMIILGILLLGYGAAMYAMYGIWR